MLLTLAAYAPILRNGFIWDDDQYLTENFYVRSPAGLADIWQITWDAPTRRFVTATPQYYPLVFSGFWLEHRLWGLNPVGYHAVNVSLHALSALLLWRLALRVGLPCAWLVAAVFAVHPVHVESVAWITERKNTLSGVFFFAALLSFARFLEARRLAWYALVWLCFVAALLSKTVAAMMPVAAALLMLARPADARRVGVWLALAPLVAVGAAAGLMTAQLEVAHVGAAGSEWSHSLLERALYVAPRAFLFYFGKIAWPEPLLFIYPRWEPGAETGLVWLGGAILLLLVAGGLALTRRTAPLWLLLYGAATLFPALGFLNVYPHRFSWVADHFQYLGSAGFIVLLILTGRGALAWLPARAQRVSGVLVSTAIVLLLAAGTFRRVPAYRDAQTLWEDTLQRNGDAWVAMLNLGQISGRAGRGGEAVSYFQRAMQYPAAGTDALGQWGNLLLNERRFAEALERFDAAIAIDPQDATLHVNRALALHLAASHEEAAAAAEHALELNPARSGAWQVLGLIRLAQNRAADAAAAFERALALGRRVPLTWVRYADALAQAGRWQPALAAYDRARALEPGRVDAWIGALESRTELNDEPAAAALVGAAPQSVAEDLRFAAAHARLLATAASAEVFDAAQAQQRIEGLLLQHPGEPLLLEALALALANIGEIPRARAALRTGLTEARARGDTRTEARLLALRVAFREGRTGRRGG